MQESRKQKRTLRNKKNSQSEPKVWNKKLKKKIQLGKTKRKHHFPSCPAVAAGFTKIVLWLVTNKQTGIHPADVKPLQPITIKPCFCLFLSSSSQPWPRPPHGGSAPIGWFCSHRAITRSTRHLSWCPALSGRGLSPSSPWLWQIRGGA